MLLPIDPPLVVARLRRSPGGTYVSQDLQDHVAELIDEMSEVEGKEQASLARMVLAYDRENIDAHIVLAEHAGSMAESIALLREAVRVGNRVWSASASTKPVDWWWEAGTRPFMRAIMAYGEALAEAAQPDQAALCFKALLEMDPDDHLEAAAALNEIAGIHPSRRR